MAFYDASYSGGDFRIAAYLPQPVLVGPPKVHTPILPKSSFVELSNLQQFSVSTFRDTKPIRVLGTNAEKARVKGWRTIAGTMIFILTNEAPLEELLGDYLTLFPGTLPGVADTPGILDSRDLPSSGLKSITDLSNGIIDTSLLFDGGRQLPGVSPQGGIRSTKIKPLDYSGNLGFLLDQLPPLQLSCLAVNEVGGVVSFALLGVQFHSESMTIGVNDNITEIALQYTAQDYIPIRVRQKASLKDQPFSIPEGISLHTSSIASQGRNFKDLVGSQKAYKEVLESTRNPFI